MVAYVHEYIAQLRADEDATWDAIADEYNEEMNTSATGKQLRQAHNRWLKRQGVGTSGDVPTASHTDGVVVEEWVKGPDGTQHIRYPGAKGVDLKAEARQVWEDAKEDFLASAEAAPVRAPEILIPGAPGMLAEIAINDSHFGMLAYGREVGEDQDINTIAEDYGGAANHLISLARVYNPTRFLYLVGNDMGHANQTGEGGKGAVTKKGTPQDVDTRLSKVFRTMRKCAVEGIDLAASIAPVDVVVVPGNHDPDEAFRLGEVLDAWYRNHPHVRIFNSPTKRKFYGYERNTFMLTHGEEFRRKRDNLPTIMATECPADLWVASEGGSREIHTGHNHIRLQGGYYPTAEVEENRGIVLRSLPGLTAVDAWHHEEGYRHRRAASLLTFHPENGFAGLHEFQPTRRTRP